MADAMEHTGERMVPEHCSGHVLWEHIYRYKFAKQFVRGRRVLDIACGEGYGSAALQVAGAISVIGMDISEDTCRHARNKYGIDARVGDAMAIALPDASVDTVVSFETVEHVPQPRRFVQECSRLLCDSGVLVISTPNVDAYNPARSAENNPFHCAEMTGTEFVELLGMYFHSVQLYSQAVVSAPMLSLAGLRARDTRWQNVRGYHRFIRSRFPDAKIALERQVQSAPVAEIVRQDGWLERLLNPYEVRHHRLGSKVQALYFVAVAAHPIRSALM
jgi:2-polyprenyl-3-methyl-5-hydroxy-6-metoxy-1,4-benzoquinol methylase